MTNKKDRLIWFLGFIQAPIQRENTRIGSRLVIILQLYYVKYEEMFSTKQYPVCDLFMLATSKMLHLNVHHTRPW